MMASRRAWLHVAGLTCFALITLWAVSQSPPDFFTIKWHWLVTGFLLSALAAAVQGMQMMIFLKHERVSASPLWSFWFTAEKAWMNSVFPAKAGTAGALVVLQKKLGVQWSRFVKFMLLCGLLTIAVSLGAAVGLMASLWMGCVFGVLLAVAVRWVFPVAWGGLSGLFVLSFLHLLCLAAGIAACLVGLGFQPVMLDIVSIGVVLNLLSVVSITPGNFGVREAVLALAAPMLTLDFSVVAQGSACYVVLRLLASLLMATLLRSKALSSE